MGVLVEVTLKVPLWPVVNSAWFTLVIAGASPSLILADDSISGWPFSENKFVADVPAAVHADGPVHETPRRRSYCVFETFGLGRMDQVEPFHDSISVRSSLPLLYDPTAVQAEGPEHDTPLSVSDSTLEVSGLGTIDHADPFQVSMSVSL